MGVSSRKIGQPVRCVRCAGGVIVPQVPMDPISEATLEDRGHDQTLPVPSAPQRSIASWNSTVPVTRGALYAIGGLIVGVGMAAFVLGWSMGTGMGQNPATQTPTRKPRIHGRLTYVTASGQTAPDAESVVLAVPVKERPDEKIAIDDLRPDSPPENLNPTIQKIRSLGGDFARTNLTGDYELEVEFPGEYYLLLLSNHAARSSEPKTNEIVELGRYFRSADKLLGRNAYVWDKQIVRGDAQTDYCFGTN